MLCNIIIFYAVFMKIDWRSLTQSNNFVNQFVKLTQEQFHCCGMWDVNAEYDKTYPESCCPKNGSGSTQCMWNNVYKIVCFQPLQTSVDYPYKAAALTFLICLLFVMFIFAFHLKYVNNLVQSKMQLTKVTSQKQTVCTVGTSVLAGNNNSKSQSLSESVQNNSLNQQLKLFDQLNINCTLVKRPSDLDIGRLLSINQLPDDPEKSIENNQCPEAHNVLAVDKAELDIIVPCLKQSDDFDETAYSLLNAVILDNIKQSFQNEVVKQSAHCLLNTVIIEHLKESFPIDVVNKHDIEHSLLEAVIIGGMEELFQNEVSDKNVQLTQPNQNFSSNQLGITRSRSCNTILALRTSDNENQYKFRKEKNNNLGLENNNRGELAHYSLSSIHSIKPNRNHQSLFNSIHKTKFARLYVMSSAADMEFGIIENALSSDNSNTELNDRDDFAELDSLHKITSGTINADAVSDVSSVLSFEEKEKDLLKTIGSKTVSEFDYVDNFADSLAILDTNDADSPNSSVPNVCNSSDSS